MIDSQRARDLRQSWLSLTDALDVERSLAHELYTDILANYQSDSRHYHTLRHVGEVLGHIERMRHLATDLDAIRLAAWYHDIVYDMQANDNESRSAEYAEDALQRMNLDADRVEAIQAMIRATDLSRSPPPELDARILMDADLGTLGSSAERYDEIADGIRLEYCHLGDEEYYRNRALVLHRFLQRERIYHTDIMFRALEKIARDNIAREIATLSEARNGVLP